MVQVRRFWNPSFYICVVTTTTFPTLLSGGTVCSPADSFHDLFRPAALSVRKYFAYFLGELVVGQSA